MLVNTIIYQNPPPSFLCMFNGAPSETLTITNVNDSTYTYSTTTNSHGVTDEPTTIVKGTYSIKGSISGYTRTGVSITEAGTYNAYPDSAIFWYGNGNNTGDTLKSKFSGFAFSTDLRPSVGNISSPPKSYTASAGTNSYNLSYSYQGTGSWKVICANAYIKTAITMGSYTKIRIEGSQSGGGKWYTTNSLVHEFSPIASSSGTPSTIAGGSYLVFNQTGSIEPYGSMNNSIIIKAIYLQ